MWILSILLFQHLNALSQTICPGCTVLNLDQNSASRSKFIQWEDIFNVTLGPRYADVDWAKEGQNIYETNEDGYFKVNAKDPEDHLKKRYFSPEELFGLDFDISPDESYSILWQTTKSKYRHSFYANYWAINMSLPIGERRKANVTLLPPGTKEIQYCGFSPNGHDMVIVADYNLYTKAEPMSVSDDAFVQHTFDGKDNVIFNGVPDWVYEEEVRQTYFSNYPSPDSRFIVFTRTDATGVQHVKFPIYGSEPYATILDYEYPKAGYTNPTISAMVVDLNDDNSTAYDLPTPQAVRAWGEHYLYTVSWADKDTVVLEWWNREQTKKSFYACNVARDNPSCDLIFGEDSKGLGWMDWWATPLWFFEGLDSFATLLPSNQGIEGNFKHICLLTKNENGDLTKKFLTSGYFDVLTIYAQINTDEKKYLFYTATKGGQRFQHVYQLDITTGKSECLSCDGHCGFASASFSGDATLYRISCWGPSAPYMQLKEVDSDWGRVLEANQDLEARLKSDFHLPQRMYQVEEISGFDINVLRIAPPDFDESSTRKYPVLLYVYGGPDTRSVRELFPYGDQRKDFHNYLANGDPGKPQFLVYHVDVRGTIGRGDDFRFPLYRKFGLTEVDDVVQFIWKLKEKPYIDDARIAIWGWSYGGFLAAKVAGHPNKVVQAAISVAPVTSFRFYDTIYTERYMGLPKDNEAYDTGDCLHQAVNFHGSNFLLIHGTADDNVHYTNAARLASALVEEAVQFRMHAYTDKAHGLSGSNTRQHLFTLIRDYLYQALNLNDDYLGTYKKEL